MEIRDEIKYVLETTFPLTSAIVSDVVWMWFGRGSDVVRMWSGRGPDVVRTWFGRGSDVFSDLVQTVWQKLREGGFQHIYAPPPLPPCLTKRHFSGEGGGCIF